MSQESNVDKFLRLAKEYESKADSLNAVREELETVERELGVDSYHQDPETKAVYKIVQPKGTFISFRDVDYKRTAMNGEKGGTVLSKKEAEEQGFELK